MNIAKRLRALASKTALDGFADELRALATEIESAAPFGYFKAEPFGWTDCQPTDKGAVALHEHPAANEWHEAVDEGLMVLHLPCPSDAREAVKALVAAHVRIALDPAVSEQAARAPLTPAVFDLICAAIDEADTISMEGDYMLDSDDCINVVRTMQALIDVCGFTTPDSQPARTK